ncbi:MAG: hypothetical protein CM15mP58_13530 [Burkholderiaceae bacterium]|nr:MAG: hypothetical protein CM15mP58_13530 [Burkholderiaceae bacterium]
MGNIKAQLAEIVRGTIKNSEGFNPAFMLMA